MQHDNNVMPDLETMGTTHNAAIVAIGAVKFNKQEGIIDHFYEVVSLQSCLEIGMEVDASTIMWWMKQSEEARAELTKENPLDITTTLKLFAEWIGDDAKVWGNGADFDNPLLANAYKKAGLPLPWKFWNNRCYRTIKNTSHIKMQRKGTYHCAVDDAESQALHLIEIWKNQTNAETKLKHMCSSMINDDTISTTWKKIALHTMEQLSGTKSTNPATSSTTTKSSTSALATIAQHSQKSATKTTTTAWASNTTPNGAKAGP